MLVILTMDAFTDYNMKDLIWKWLQWFIHTRAETQAEQVRWSTHLRLVQGHSQFTSLIPVRKWEASCCFASLSLSQCPQRQLLCWMPPFWASSRSVSSASPSSSRLLGRMPRPGNLVPEYWRRRTSGHRVEELGSACAVLSGWSMSLFYFYFMHATTAISDCASFGFCIRSRSTFWRNHMVEWSIVSYSIVSLTKLIHVL